MKYGEENNNWRGGRLVSSNGYIILRVGVDHHLADVRGYAYEHRVVAEQVLGRRLKPGEIVHHINGDKQDNRKSNLQVVEGNAGHFVHHRKATSNRRLPNEANPTVECECGCGHVFAKYDISGRPRRFVSGHNRQFRTSELTEFIYSIVSNFPSESSQIAEYAGITRRKATQILSTLKRRGLVRRTESRSWVA